MLKNLQNVLIKPSGPDCNMACTYCFYSEKKQLFNETPVHRMNDTVLNELVKQVMQNSGPNINFNWQGGEPTLMGLDFFKKTVELEEKYGHQQNIGNGFQTNGLLINVAWAEFFYNYKFLIGLSIDGPEHVHNHYRKTKNDSGTWDIVNGTAELLLDMDVAVNAMSVVNEYSVNYPDEIYSFFKESGLTYMQFIPCVEYDKSTKTIASFSTPADKFGKFLTRIFDLWISDFKEGIPTTSVRFFDSVLYNYVKLPPPSCLLQENCGDYVVIEHNGDIFSCDFFVEDEWLLGNIMNDNILECLNSKKQNDFGLVKHVKSQSPCNGCQWINYCRGGCPKDYTGKTNYLCAAYKEFFSHAHGEFQKLAEKWKREQGEVFQ